MHDILRYQRGEWPEAVVAILSSAEGFRTAVVRESGTNPNECCHLETIARMEIRSEAVRLGGSRLVRGLLWYALDGLAQAHAIFQEEPGFLGAYCHGMMHRREGDFWNANYWFRAAGKAPFGMFEAGFSPERLTDACERAVHGDQEEVIQHLAEEAARILDHLFRREVPSKTKPSAETD
jgi:hypothetical protein